MNGRLTHRADARAPDTRTGAAPAAQCSSLRRRYRASAIPWARARATRASRSPGSRVVTRLAPSQGPKAPVAAARKTRTIMQAALAAYSCRDSLGFGARCRLLTAFPSSPLGRQREIFAARQTPSPTRDDRCLGQAPIRGKGGASVPGPSAPRRQGSMSAAPEAGTPSFTRRTWRKRRIRRRFIAPSERLISGMSG